MTTEFDKKTLTVGALLAMMNKLVEVDGEIADTEKERIAEIMDCLLYTSDAADE